MARSKAQLDNLKKGTWKKGQSGNPKGKPSGTLSLTNKMRALLAEAISTKDGKKMEAAEMLARQIFKRALAGNDNMAKLIWNYMDGMPKMNFDATADINVHTYTHGQIESIARRIIGIGNKSGKKQSGGLPDSNR